MIRGKLVALANILDLGMLKIGHGHVNLVLAILFGLLDPISLHFVGDMLEYPFADPYTRVLAL